MTTPPTSTYPQVALFGSMRGGWRQQYLIPVLDDLGVTYYDPEAPQGWTEEYGLREADIMAQCETIIIVLNCETPAFTSLAEAGWAALGAVQRGQNFLLYVEEGCEDKLQPPLQNPQTEELKIVRDWMVHWVKSSRYLVINHAKAFDIETMFVADSVEALSDKVREIYG